MDIYSITIGGLPEWYLGTFYGSQDIEENLEHTSKHVRWLTRRGKPWLVGGDWNVEAEEMEARKRCLSHARC